MGRMSENRNKMMSINSLPRLFGKKKAKLGERVDHVVEGRARGEMTHTMGKVTMGNQMVVTSAKSLVELPLSSASSNQSMTSTAYSEHSFNNENLYVNGQVPRGQFKEYFSVPALEHRLEHLEAQNSEENGPAKPARSFLLGPDSSFFSRNVTTRKSALSMQPQPSSLPIPHFERAGSERGSLRKARSVDDFVDSTDRFEDTLNTLIGSPNTMGLPPGSGHMRGEMEDDMEDEEEMGECAYYNVQFARKARSSSHLTQQSLRHHDSKQTAVNDSNYIQHLIKAQQRDPFGSSFLGHSLVTDKAEESMNTMVGDLDDNTLQNSLIENQLDELDNTLLVNNNGRESPKCTRQALELAKSGQNVMQSNFLQSTLLNNTNTTLSLGNALQCNTISKINIIPLNHRSRKNILSHTNNLNMDSTYKVLQSTMVNREVAGDAESLDSGAGSLGPCSILGPEQSAIGTQIDSPEKIHFMANLLDGAF